MIGLTYVVPEEYKELLTGMSLSGISDDQLGAYLTQASRTVDNYCHRTFGLTKVEDEITVFNRDSQVVYPRVSPVRAVINFRLVVGSRQTAVISPRDIFISPTQNRLEVITLATTTTLASNLISTGLSQVHAQYDYIAGDGELVTSTTTISADVTDSPDSTGSSDITVTDGTRFTVDDIINIDRERMLITAIATNILTVLRGINHITDAHTSGATVYRLASIAPDEIKVAVAMTATSHIVARRQQEEGIAGVRSFLIGSYSVSYGPNAGGAVSSGFMSIPVEATRMLDSFRVISMR